MTQIKVQILNVADETEKIMKLGETYFHKYLSARETRQLNDHAKPNYFLIKRIYIKKMIEEMLMLPTNSRSVNEDIIIYHDSLGCPKIKLKGEAQIFQKNMNISHIDVSISDLLDYVVLFITLN